MGQYRITVDRLDNVADEPTITVIDCSTRYTLREDIAEWVREEIDMDASIREFPRPEGAEGEFDEDTAVTDE